MVESRTTESSQEPYLGAYPQRLLELTTSDCREELDGIGPLEDFSAVVAGGGDSPRQPYDDHVLGSRLRSAQLCLELCNTETAPRQ